MAENAKTKELPADVAKKYTVKPGIGIGEVQFKGKSYFLDTITVAQADALVKNGFKSLVLKAEEVKPK